MGSSATSLQRKSDPTFKIFSAALKATEVEGRKRLSCTASSSVEDLHGDTMTDECVRDMAKQAKAKNMTIFLNHRYAVPEDVMGSTVDSRSVSRAHDTAGQAIWDMDLDIDVNETNPRALNTYAAVKDAGVKLGVSIGANIEEWEFKDAEKGWWGGLIIKKVNLLEASVVGIPANPRSWVTNAVKALKSAYNVDDTNTELEGDAAGPLTVKSVETKFFLDGKDVTDQLTRVTTEKDAEPDEDSTYTVKGVEEALYVETVHEADGVKTITLTPKAIGEIREGLGKMKQGVAEDDTEDADGDAGDEGTDAASDEGTADGEDDEATKAEAPTSTVDLEAAKAAATSAETETGDSSTLKTLILSLVENLETVMQERDAARDEVRAKEALLAEAAEIISIIAKTPLGRKTAFVAPVKTFKERFGGIYDEGFLQKLDERE